MSLKSEEDQIMYFDHIVQQHGTRYAVEVVKALGASIELERIMTHLLDDGRKRLLENQDGDSSFLNIDSLEGLKENAQAELEMLKAASMLTL